MADSVFRKPWSGILKILAATGLFIIVIPASWLTLSLIHWKLTENKRFINHLPAEIKKSRLIAKESSHGGMCGIAAFGMTETTTQAIKNKALNFFERSGGYPEWKEFPYQNHEDNRPPNGYDAYCAPEFLKRYGVQIDHARKNPGSYYMHRGDNEIWIFPSESMAVYTYFD